MNIKVANYKPIYKDQKCDYVWVEVFVPNIKTHELYKKMGYQDRDIDMIKKINQKT